jgi:hypothetical protein
MRIGRTKPSKSINKPVLIMRAAALAAALALLFSVYGCNSEQQGVIRIGAPDGAASIISNYAADIAGRAGNLSLRVADSDSILKVSKVHDCCGSLAQFALASHSVDAALLCPDAAADLVKKDSSYIIAGPYIVNSEIVVVRDAAKATRIGISQNHSYQAAIVERLFGPECRATAMLPAVLSYAYEEGLVDGIVVDIEQGINLPGEKMYIGTSGDVVTYQLVVREDLAGMAGLISAYSAAAEALNNADNLQKIINTYSEERTSGGEAVQWLQAGIHFLTKE